MAPPPPANLPLQQRVIKLAQTLQFAWFCGHLTLLFCSLRYGLSYITTHWYSKWARFSYRTAFVAAAATYGIVVYKAYRARARTNGKQQPGALALLSDENVQYLAMALVWLFFHQIPLAILPFAVYSVFHVATYTRANLIPTIQPPQATPAGAKPASNKLADTIGKFVKEYYDASMHVVAVLEILLFFRLLAGALTFGKGTWILFGIYSVFFRARYSQSSFVQHAIGNAVAHADAIIANQSTPPVVRQAWDSIKGVTRQAVDATEARRYTGAAGPGVKKAQ
ncbi:hypothetical protein L228DRAFT_282091 [Xylona heveae TC161]|uniref:Endoplasmic reticulum protein n=1 Tax=Xylona heveae (strain CBS 132557 / TC161) TaxID=1328760 RepID=A0A165HDU2_XYLHT|nr:hypothetical protein L228DRAFT_282091 [Xylona heveae TC161]KZF23358.1 hypothetical protein L228DRAFT_282091 [Xylona heveae TC161]